MKTEYREAFTEVYEIFLLMPKELLVKIPKKFCEMIEEERDKEYYPNIKEPLEQQKLKEETVIILGLIYRDFLCSPEEKKKLQEKDARELQEVQKALEDEMRQKYNIDDIFKNKSKVQEKQLQQSEERSIIVVQEEKWYRKLFNIIKRLFWKNS